MCTDVRARHVMRSEDTATRQKRDVITPLDEYPKSLIWEYAQLKWEKTLYNRVRPKYHGFSRKFYLTLRINRHMRINNLQTWCNFAVIKCKEKLSIVFHSNSMCLQSLSWWHVTRHIGGKTSVMQKPKSYILNRERVRAGTWLTVVPTIDDSIPVESHYLCNLDLHKFLLFSECYEKNNNMKWIL